MRLARELHTALTSGWTVDKAAVVRVLLHVDADPTQSQLEPLQAAYAALFQTPLPGHLRDKLGGDAGLCARALALRDLQYDADEVFAALGSTLVPKAPLVDTICPKAPEELRALAGLYAATHREPLLQALGRMSDGAVKRVLVGVVKAAVQQQEPQQQQQQQQQQQRHDVGEDVRALDRAQGGMFGADETAFADLLANRPREYIAEVKTPRAFLPPPPPPLRCVVYKFYPPPYPIVGGFHNIFESHFALHYTTLDWKALSLQ